MPSKCNGMGGMAKGTFFDPPSLPAKITGSHSGQYVNKCILILLFELGNFEVNFIWEL